MAEGDPRDRILAALHDHRAVAPLWICQVCTTLVPVTGEVAQGLATLQFALGEGPTVQAVSTGRPVLVSELREVGHTSWPMFAEAASRTPARALYCFPLQAGALRVGVLDLYRDQPGPLSTAELAGALLCADVAPGALLD